MLRYISIAIKELFYYADVECFFLLRLSESSESKEVTFITAFPVSLYRIPYMDLQKFSVTVDGEHPPMIRRKTDTTEVSTERKDILIDKKYIVLSLRS